MNDQNTEQPDSPDFQPAQSAQPAPTVLSGGSSKSIQPVSDMSAYAPRPETQTTPQVAPTPLAPAGTVQTPLASPVVASVEQTTPQPIQTAQSTNGIPQQPQAFAASPAAKTGATLPALSEPVRIAKIMPSLQLFAIALLAYGTYELLASRTLSVVTSIIKDAGLLTVLSNLGNEILLSFIFGTFLILLSIVTGVYAFFAKNFNRLNTILSVLLFLIIINVLQQLFGLVGMLNYVSVALRMGLLGSIVSFIFSLGIAAYIWNVKSQVAIASIGRE